MNRAVERLRGVSPDSELRQQHRAGHSPWIVSAKLKLIDGCNLRCFMCDYWKKDREGELSTDEIFEILADLSALQCRKIHLTGGELFLRKDALDVVRRATELGMRVNLTTNGTILPKKRVKELVKIPARGVTVSLDSPVSRIHDQVRGQEGSWRTTRKAIEHLLRYRGPKTRVRINTVVSRRNFRSLVEMPGFLREHPVDQWLLIPMEKWVGDEAVMTADDIRYYNARIAPMLADTIRLVGFDPWIYGHGEDNVRASEKQEYALGHYRNNLCHVPWFHTLIGPQGDVYPCCGTHRRIEPLGNIRKERLVDLFNGAAYRELRVKMLRERMPACHHCDDFLKENRAIDATLAEASR